MKLLSVDNFVDFTCIGDKCPISCCGGDWGIFIDDDSMEYYRSVKGEFGEKLRAGITKMNGENAFRLDEKTKDCIFLNEHKLCKIYLELGEDALCETCKTYPRMLYDVGDVTFCYLTNSCPEVNRMIMQRKSFLEILFDDSAEDENDQKAAEFDPKKFNNAISAFTIGMHILQNRNISLSSRLYLVLFFIYRFQELTRSGSDISNFFNLFSNEEVYHLFLENKSVNERNYAGCIRVFMIIYRSLMSEAYDHSMWVGCRMLADSIVNHKDRDTEVYIDAFRKINDEMIQNELEQIITYRYFVVFMQGFKDMDYFDKFAYEIIKMIALVTYIALTEAIQGRKCTQEDRITFYSMCGRIDHSCKRKEKLINELKREGFYELDMLIRIVG